MGLHHEKSVFDQLEKLCSILFYCDTWRQNKKEATVRSKFPLKVKVLQLLSLFNVETKGSNNNLHVFLSVLKEELILQYFLGICTGIYIIQQHNYNHYSKSDFTEATYLPMKT